MRSMLFVPGNRPELVAKATASGADALIFDLEDAVPEAAKAEARAHLATLGPPGLPLYVRVNGAETPHLWDDVAAAGAAGAAGIVLPKAEDPSVVARIDGALTVSEIAAGTERGATALLPLIESALGVLRTRELCAATPRIRAVLFGSGEEGDLVADLGCEWTPEGTGLLTARGQVVLGARAAGVADPMDAVYMD
ncbi:MAG: HpcH/HpaI aldolase/citrate lyase family protein, partial [Acidimicrobiales bacterium]